ncbi:MAG: excisionase [Comamonadaceae bacterium]|nr:MAG: excisionase [Comamonadaceae bacterium]
MTARYVRIPKFCAETGYTARAVETKIHRGVWVESRQYRRAPDGCIFIDMEGFEKWVEGQKQAESDRVGIA